MVLAVVGAITGSLGTLFGMYNQKEIDNLSKQISNLKEQQDILFQMTNSHHQQIRKLVIDMNRLTDVVDALLIHNPTVFQAQLEEQIDILAERLDTAIDVIQQLQLRRLSVSLLNGDQISAMHQSLLTMAQNRGLTLFPERLSDYFQLETSYLRQGENVLVMVHVPCVHPKDQLKLYRYVGYPIKIPALTKHEHTLQHALYNGTFTDTIEPLANHTHFDGLFVKPESELIGVNSLQHYKLISETELSFCNHHSRIILCNNHQVLRTDLADSCLGSLFLKSLEGAQEHCKFVRKPLSETVYQISPTEYLIFSINAFTPQAVCLNGTHFPVFLSAGNNRVSMPPGCSAQLKENIITSDIDITLTPEPIQTIWEWDPLTFSFSAFHDIERVDQQIRSLHKDLADLKSVTGTNDTWATQFRNHLSVPSNYPWYWYAFLGFLGFTLLVLIFCYLCKCTKVFAPCHRLSALLTTQAPSTQEFLGVAYQMEPPSYGKATAPLTQVVCTHQQPLGNCHLCSLRPRV